MRSGYEGGGSEGGSGGGPRPYREEPNSQPKAILGRVDEEIGRLEEYYMSIPPISKPIPQNIPEENSPIKKPDYLHTKNHAAYLNYLGRIKSDIDCPTFAWETKEFIVKEAEKRKGDLEKPRLLVPLSGGVDSSTVAALCGISGLETKAITISDSLGYSRPQDIRDAKLIANKFGLEHEILDATSIYATIPQGSPLIKAHTMMGFRRSLLNSIAEKEQRVMVGTGNLSEFYSGLFCYNTLLGQIFPIDDLFKTQVYQLADYLLIDRESPSEHISEIAKKPSHSGIVGEETDEEKMGMRFEEFDVIAFLLKNKRRSPKSIARELGYEQSFIESIKKCADESKIKMTFPLLKSRSLFKRILSLSL